MQDVLRTGALIVMALTIGWAVLAVDVLLGVFFVVFWAVPAWIADEQGKAKNRAGLWWGFWLGWLGVLAMAALPSVTESAATREP